MLSIGKLGRGQESYYLAAVAQGVEDYYTGSGESPGEWVGTGAARLGLVGEVDPDQLRAILGGTRPDGGDRLGGPARVDRVPGWDLTWSTPKSVSVLWALGWPEIGSEVAAAHRAAVVAGLGYLERHAVVSRRRVEGHIEWVRAEGLVAAAFPHRTSRAGDPQLHTHVLVANVVERVDGGWGALHSPVIYQHARTAGFVYQAVLRSELARRLGVAWGPVVNGYADIDGIDQRLLDLFSTRRAEIVGSLTDRGEDSPRAAATAVLDTRRAKDYAVDPDTLWERWRAEAAELDPTLLNLSTAIYRAPAPGTPESIGDITARLAGPDGLTADQASFDRRDVTRAWCQQAPAGTTLDLAAIEALVDRFVTATDVVPIVDGPRPGAEAALRADGTTASPRFEERRWSTVEMLATEQQLIDRAARSRGLGVGVVPADVVAAVVDGAGLSDEQIEMVQALTTRGDGIDVVVGRAGTGKTYALAAATRAWRSGGWRPVGVAVAARAAAELEASAGLPSSTLARLLLDCDQTSGSILDHRTVVVLDEAGMVGTRMLDRLVAHVAAADAKLVLVGDHHQLPPVDAGGAFAGLARRLDAIELTENRRQVEGWERDTLDLLRVSHRAGMAEVVERYADRGRIHLAATPRDLHAAMVSDWYRLRCAGDGPVMLALRRLDVDLLNQAARALLVADGSVATVGADLGGRTFATGDRVVCLHNDARIGVHNALFATIDTVGPNSFLLLDERTERHIEVPFSYAKDGHLDLAYATTIHKAQGATYSHALLLGDDRLYRQGGYTALSRGRVRNDIYLVATDDYDLAVEPHGTPQRDTAESRFTRALGRDSAKDLATDLTRPTTDQPARSLAALWAERDALGGQPDADETVGRLDAEIAHRAALAGRAAEIDRPAHITDLLGDPPDDLGGREAWRAAAGAIESYRARWTAELDDLGHIDTMEQAAHLNDVAATVAGFDGIDADTPALAL